MIYSCVTDEMNAITTLQKVKHKNTQKRFTDVLTHHAQVLLFTTSETTTEQGKMMATQIPQEVIEMAQGAVRMMIEDGVTVDMFKDIGC